MAKFLSFFLALNDYIINSSTIKIWNPYFREYNFVMEAILVKSFAQAHVHTVHSTRAFSKCTWAKPFPKIVPMFKLDIPMVHKLWFIIFSTLFWLIRNCVSFNDRNSKEGNPGNVLITSRNYLKNFFSVFFSL